MAVTKTANGILTVKQKKFVDEYLKCGELKAAALKAGYAESTANERSSEMLKKPAVQEYMNKQLAKIDKKVVADAQEVMEFLTGVMRGTVKKKILMQGSEGFEEIETEFSDRERLKSAELLGKRYKLFTDVQQLENKQEVIIIDDVTVEEADNE